MDIEKAKKQFELVKDTETFVITTVTFKSLLEELEELKEKVRQYEMMYHNTGAMFNRMTMKEKIERYEKSLKDIMINCDNPSFRVVAKMALENK